MESIPFSQVPSYGHAVGSGAGSEVPCMRQGRHDPVVGIMHLSSALLPFRNSKPFLRLGRCHQLGLSKNVWLPPAPAYSRDALSIAARTATRIKQIVSALLLLICALELSDV